jgi:hypothetical protein
MCQPPLAKARRAELSRGPQRFRQGDVLKMIKAAKAAGSEVASITVDRDGKIQVELVISKEQSAGKPGGNEWDSILK